MSKRLRGDNGLTDLFDRHDLRKSGLRFEVLGALDEASSALGLVRACHPSLESSELILEIQYDLCWMMAELAIVSEDQRPEMRITVERLDALEGAYSEITTAYPLPSMFVIPGDSLVGAQLHMARSIIRRAERRVILLDQESPLPNPNIIPYLNRLSTLMFAMAHAEETSLGILKPTLAHHSEKGS
jgi:cob(I)alamin adenosyltransferase